MEAYSRRCCGPVLVFFLVLLSIGISLALYPLFMEISLYLSAVLFPYLICLIPIFFLHNMTRYTLLVHPMKYLESDVMWLKIQS